MHKEALLNKYEPIEWTALLSHNQNVVQVQITQKPKTSVLQT